LFIRFALLLDLSFGSIFLRVGAGEVQRWSSLPRGKKNH